MKNLVKQMFTKEDLAAIASRQLVRQKKRQQEKSASASARNGSGGRINVPSMS
jgi:hypothetical protein